MKKTFIGLIIIIPLLSFTYPLEIKKIGIEQGLSSDYIQGITMDKQGFMWFGSKSGLNRFDGRNFKVYMKSGYDLNTINSNDLNYVYADKFQDIIWIATERSGLNAFDYSKNQFSVYWPANDNHPRQSADGITFMANDAVGNLWVATYQSGIILMKKDRKQYIHYDQSNVKGLGSNYNWCLADDYQGSLYAGHVFDGLSVISLHDRTAVNFRPNPADPFSLPGYEVLSILIDSKKRVWIGTNNGLALFNKAAGRFTVFRKNSRPGSLSNNVISTITEINNEIWIGTSSGIDILDNQNEIIENSDKIRFSHIPALDNQTGLSHPIINSIMQDCFNNIWIGTVGGGVNFLSGKSDYFHTLSYTPTGKSTGLNSKIVLGLCTDSNGLLWVGTEGGGVDVFKNGMKVRNYGSENKSFTDNRITAVLKDSKNNIWCGIYDGTILCYNASGHQFNKITGFNTDGIQIRCFCEDQNHSIWIGTNKGLHLYNTVTGEKRSYYSSNSGLPENVIRSLSTDQYGRIWVGTLGSGVSIFTKDFKLFRRFDVQKGFYGINHIYQDSRHRMWVAARENLLMFRNCNDTSFTVYGLKEGLPNGYVRAVTEGTPDIIWISTNSGLSCLNLRTNKISNFNQMDGVPVGDFMSGAVVKDQNGTIYFGSQNGICYFNSNIPRYTFKIPLVVVTEFTVINKESAHTGNFTDMPVSKRIELSYNQNTVNIAFNVLDYSLNDKVEFSYRLDGLDNAWYNIHNSKQLTFRNLRPGKYIFNVKSRLRNQDREGEITTLEILIRPPFWFSWWAETVYAIIVLIIVLYITRFFKHRLDLENSLYLEKKNHQQEQELNEERLRFYTNITHELRTPLTLIIGPLEDLISDKSLQPNQAKKINSIHRSANRLLDLINQILEFRKSETRNRKLSVARANLSELVKETGLKYEELNQNKNIEFNIQLKSVQDEMYFDEEVITIILDNLISNALKYTPKGEITLMLKNRTEENTRYTDIVVSDTGYGISKEVLPRIFDRYYQVKDKHQMSGSGIGLSLVKNMVELHQGSISVKSIPGEGTTFTFSLLTDNSYPDALHAEQKEIIEPEQVVNSNQLILVVEDNAEIHDYIRDCFSDLYDVLIAENGKTGLELAIEKIPDIIISDIMMPLMDGIEMCKLLKEDFRTCHIPVVLLTAKDSIQDKTEGYNIGADSYITKPFSGNLLRSRVTNLLENRKKIIALFASSNNQKQTILKDSLSKLDNEFIDKVTAIIEENLETEQINITQIADQMFMSHSTLYRKIKALTGLSVNEFVRKIRMRNAEKLLLTGKYTVIQIISMIGISNPAYFRQCFRDEFGVTPTDYIKNIKNGIN
jgi:signal transduction histidine kinase/ligand-binding sensor domain-containing protein/DNA-binding response OmpR family regulator